MRKTCPYCGGILTKEKGMPQPDEIYYNFELIDCEKCEKTFARNFTNGELEEMED